MKNLFSSFLVFSFLILFFSNDALSQRTMGGEINYTPIGPYTYAIEMIIYQKCSAPNLDPSYTINFNSPDCAANSSITATYSSTSIIDLNLCSSEVNDCVGAGSYGLEAHIYTATLDLNPWISCGDEWEISSRILRRPSGALDNTNGGTQGLFLTTTIDNTITPPNTSSSLNNYPTFFAYQNSITSISLPVTDVDSDSLRFNLVDALDDDGVPVNYSGTFSGAQPFGAGVISLDPVTGVLTFTNPPAMFGVIAIEIKEYRNGVLIGRKVIDWNFEVLPGTNEAPNLSGINGGTDTSMTTCVQTPTCFDILLTDANPTDILNASIDNPDFSISQSPGPTGNSVTLTVCRTFLSSGTYYLNITGFDDRCPFYDSTSQTYSVTVTDDNLGSDTRSECSPFTWIDGNTYTSDNSSATHTIPNGTINGCDSIISLDLTILSPATSTDTRTECSPFVWIDGNTYTADNSSATHTITNGAVNGCDSTITLDLTIIFPTTSTDTRTECSPYIWIDGNTYTADNSIATHTIPNGSVNGCDSAITLDLTILNPATSTDTRTECSPFVWIDGNTYTADNSIATHTISNGAANGCDSVVTLDLTILNPAAGTDTRTECSPFIWIDGNTYTSDNSAATHTIQNGASNGCDSIITLNLSIQLVDVNVSMNGLELSSSNSSNVNYQWLDCDDNYSVIQGQTNQTFTPSSNGSYAVMITENNCIDTSSCQTISTLFVSESNLNSKVVVYPNPVSELLYIDLGNAESKNLQIIDLNGKVVYEIEKTIKQYYSIPTNFNPGVYFLQVSGNSNLERIKFVKK